jgi:Protein of unknown function (DUF3365)
MIMHRQLGLVVMFTIGMGVLIAGLSRGAKEHQPDIAAALTVPAIQVTDYLHAVIESHRTFYTVQVVERLQLKGAMVASHNWRAAPTLPLPAQFLMEANELGANTGSRVRYKLISRWPINPHNAPESEFEKKGLDAVEANQDRPYAGVVTTGKEKWFTAIYADIAMTQACVGCHNSDPMSPKRDFKGGDVMGAVMISIPAGE